MNKLFTQDELRDVIEQPKNGVGTGIGLYRNGYRVHGKDFWGIQPGGEVRYFLNEIHDILWDTCSVLEIGAGTGKNIFEFVRYGVRRAVAVEIDSLAVAALLNILVSAEEAGLIPEGRLAVIKDDVLHFLGFNSERFDIVVSYGLLHVFKEKELLDRVFDLTLNAVKDDGYLIVQSLTDKYPAPVTQPELEGVIVTPELVRQSCAKRGLELIHWNEKDIIHSHAGSEEDHRHGSVRAIFKSRNT